MLITAIKKSKTIMTQTNADSLYASALYQTNLYKVLYCGLYRMGFRKLSIGAGAATIVLSALVLLNGWTALNILQHAQVLSVAFIPGSLVAALGIMVLLFNLYYFHGMKQNKLLVKEVKNEFWYLGDIYAFVYVVVSITLFLETL